MRAIVPLEGQLDHKDRSIREAAAAAIDAIRNRNHHYFQDRQHTGKVVWDPAND